MDGQPLTLRVFLSSPGDVGEERRLARDVMRELAASHLLRGQVHFDVVAWDDPDASTPMEAGETPQVSVNRHSGRPAECDLTLVILWSRLGTRLPPGMARPDGSQFASGTVWEYEDARAANKPVYVYRRTATPHVAINDPDFEHKRAQYVAVEAFVAHFTNPDGSFQGGVNTYATPEEFRALLRQHLEAFVTHRLESRRHDGTIVSITADGTDLPILSARPRAALQPAGDTNLDPHFSTRSTVQDCRRARTLSIAALAIASVSSLLIICLGLWHHVSPPFSGQFDVATMIKVCTLLGKPTGCDDTDVPKELRPAFLRLAGLDSNLSVYFEYVGWRVTILNAMLVGLPAAFAVVRVHRARLNSARQLTSDLISLRRYLDWLLISAAVSAATSAYLLWPTTDLLSAFIANQGGDVTALATELQEQRGRATEISLLLAAVCLIPISTAWAAISRATKHSAWRTD